MRRSPAIRQIWTRVIPTAAATLLVILASGCPESRLLPVDAGENLCDQDAVDAGQCPDTTTADPVDSGDTTDGNSDDDDSPDGADTSSSEDTSDPQDDCSNVECPDEEACYRGTCYTSCSTGERCKSGEFCRKSACVPAADCQPRTCKEAGADCGTISDKCGGEVKCGDCQPPETCGGGGQPNRCGEPESCDGKDNNGNGVVDEGCPCDYNGLSQGVCSKGVKNGSGKCTEPKNYEADEFSCDQIDNDCDGKVDEASKSGGSIACQPGSTDTKDCARCGTQKRTCLKNCTWGNWSTCQNQGTCKPGDMEQQSCGRCGSQTRRCGNNCQWESWGTCTGQGQCRAGQTQQQSCGNCGTKTRSCSGSCTWGTWSTCRNQGQCSPGQTTSQGCPGPCMAKECSASCSWSNRCTGCTCQGFETCGYSCRDGYHITRKFHDFNCDGNGIDDNAVRCEPNCGTRFTKCGSQCPTGYHDTRRTRRHNCGGTGIRDNAVVCEID